MRRSARPACRCAARLRPGLGYWGPRPNPAQLLFFLVRRILKFHESEPLLNPASHPELWNLNSDHLPAMYPMIHRPRRPMQSPSTSAVIENCTNSVQFSPPAAESTPVAPPSASHGSPTNPAGQTTSILLARNNMQTRPTESSQLPGHPPQPSTPISPPPQLAAPQNEPSANSVQFRSIPFSSVCNSQPPPAATQPPPVSSQPSGTHPEPAFHDDRLPPVSDNCQSATINPQTLWSPQPGEDPVAYHLFAAWLQLPVPRPSRKAAAAALGCSVHRLSQFFNRYRWKTRTTAFDHHRAAAANRALEALLQQETKDWHERACAFRLQEWSLHETMLAIAHTAVAEVKKHPRRVTLAQICKLLDLTSILGHRATGRPLDPAAVPPAPPPPNPSFEDAVQRIYGDQAQNDPKTALSPPSATVSAPGPHT